MTYRHLCYIGDVLDIIVDRSVQFTSIAQSCPTLQPHESQHARLLCPWDSPGKNTGVGCHFLLQGIFPSEGSNPRVLHWQVDALPLNHLGSPQRNSQGLFFLMPPGRRTSRDPAGCLCPLILNFQVVLERCGFVSSAFISCTGKLLLFIMSS